MTLWLLQDVGKSQMLEDNFETVKQLGFDFTNIGVIAEVKQIPGLSQALTLDASAFVVRAGVKIIESIHCAKNLNDILDFPFEGDHDKTLAKLKKGVFYSLEKFDQFYYSNLDLPLLNKDAFYLEAHSNLGTKFERDYFIKPSKDLKSLIPGIIKAGQTIEDFILNSEHRVTIFNEQLLFAPVQSILAEYRFFVVDNKVVTGSQYKIDDAVKYSSVVPEHVLNTAREYAQYYQPHDVFTMDLAIMQDQSIKIVEYNCWNGSGLYFCDKPKLFKAVQNYVARQL